MIVKVFSVLDCCSISLCHLNGVQFCKNHFDLHFLEPVALYEEFEK